MNRQMRSWLYIVVVILLLAACSNEKREEELEVAVPPKQEVNPEEPEEVELYMAPFTGMMSEEESTMRPILATINNHPLARPQSGISEADIVYEFIAEGNVTRLLALFQSELPEQIGPIRSARDYFIYTAKGLDAFYVAHGYSPDALALLRADYVDYVNGMQYDGTLFKRSSDRKAPHNSYISKESMLTAMEKVNAHKEINKMPSLSFHEALESVKIGDTVNNIVVKNGTHPNFTSAYSYDDELGTYDRTVNDVVTIDKANDQKVELSNVLVFEAQHRTIDAEGRQAVDIETGGKALLFQGGTAKAIEWRNINGILEPVENGTPVKLVPGKTWIHVVSQTPGIEAAVSYTP